MTDIFDEALGITEEAVEKQVSMNLAKIELRAYLLVPMCQKCEEICGKKPGLVLTDAEKPQMETWVCPSCGAESEYLKGQLPHLIHEEVETGQFQLPELTKVDP